MARGEGSGLFRPFAGRVWRIVAAPHLPDILTGARHPEGRFHHDGQAAIYLSPSPENASFAIDIYLRPEDPPRVIQPLWLASRSLLDLRDPAVMEALGLKGTEPSVPWMPERAAGQPATSWRASDAARDMGADGILFASRRAPERWHLTLFRWNDGRGTRLTLDGPAQPWQPG